MFFLKIKYLVIIAITFISLSIDVTAADDVYSLIKDRLNLTEEQSEKFEPIILYQWEKRQAVMKKHGISRESNLSKKKIGFRQLREIKKDMDKINKDIEKKLIKVLNKDQLVEYKKIQEENRIEMRARLRGNR
jgi:hypothetical protein|tara:strand:- start:100 stop:498 length:399 start_codon:yes stop_codon:yes gene_type:complete